MKYKNLFFLIILIFILIIKISIAELPPPPTPPSFGDVAGNEVQGTIETCSDGTKNQDETDVDCGGVCGKCQNEKACSNNADCSSNYCNPDNKCSVPSSAQNTSNNQQSNNKDDNEKNNSDNKSKILYASLILNFIIIFLFIAYYILTQKKLKQTNEAVSQEPFKQKQFNVQNNDSIKLKNYISRCLRQGYSPQAIRQTLLRQNWPEMEINKAFNELRF